MAWVDYCLINTTGKRNKFFADDGFSKTIIKENMNKVKQSANAILDKFLGKTIALNIISYAIITEVMTRKSGATHYCNYYSVINNTIDFSKLIQLLVENNVFD